MLLIGKVHLIKSFHQRRRPCERERGRENEEEEKSNFMSHIVLSSSYHSSFFFFLLFRFTSRRQRREAPWAGSKKKRRRYPSLTSPLSSLSFSAVIIGWLEFSLYLTKTAVRGSFFLRHSLAWPMKTKTNSSILWVCNEIYIFIDRLHF